MSWLVIATAAYLLNSLAFIVDKALLGHAIKNQYVYTFFIGTLGLIAVLLVPLIGFANAHPGFYHLLVDQWHVPTYVFDASQLAAPTVGWWGIELLIGILLIAALVFFFSALKELETSRVVPFIGGLIPLTTFIFSFFYLDEQLSSTEIIAFVLLLVGGVVISLGPKQKGRKQGPQHWWYAVAAAVLFSSSFVLTKYAYISQPFLTVFIVARLGSFFAALALLCVPSIRAAIVQTIRRLRSRLGLIFVASQAVGAAGFLLLNVAIKLKNVTLVNALQGIQYIFLLALVSVATVFYPKLLKERITPMIIAGKVLGIIFISAGLWVLAKNGV